MVAEFCKRVMGTGCVISGNAGSHRGGEGLVGLFVRRGEDVFRAPGFLMITNRATQI